MMNDFVNWSTCCSGASRVSGLEATYTSEDARLVSVQSETAKDPGHDLMGIFEGVPRGEMLQSRTVIREN